MKHHGENSSLGARSWKMRIFLVWTLFLVRAMSTGQANPSQGFWQSCGEAGAKADQEAHCGHGKSQADTKLFLWQLQGVISEICLFPAV